MGEAGLSYPLHRDWDSADTGQSGPTEEGFGGSTGSAVETKAFRVLVPMRPNGGHNPTFLRVTGMKLSLVSPLSCQQWVGQTERMNSKLPCHSVKGEPQES